MLRALFIIPQVTHYRITFYEKLIRQTVSVCEWVIIDGEKKKDDGRPSLRADFPFPHKRFPETLRSIGPFRVLRYEGLLEYVKKEKPEIVVMSTIGGTITYHLIARWCRKNNSRLILWSCLWEDESTRKSRLNGIKMVFVKSLVRQAALHITYSSYAKTKLISWGISPQKIRIAYNGLDIEGLEDRTMPTENADLLRKSLAPVDRRVLLYVGGVSFDKKVYLLVDAFNDFNKKHPENDCHVLIIGDGPDLPVVKKKISRYGLENKVSLLGRIVDDVDNYFQIADCLVLPGCGGLALNQALYWGKPCIVSHADGTEDDLIIDKVTGFRFVRGSKEDLTLAIEQFYMADKEDLGRLSVHGKDIISTRSNVNYMVNVFSDSIKSLIS